jgi:hypothetical protein
MHDVRRMVALGVESGREREHVGGTELHTEAAGFATLDDNGNTSFWHGISTFRAVDPPGFLDVIMLGGGGTGCDNNHGRW